jgi:hypothetical protein
MGMIVNGLAVELEDVSVKAVELRSTGRLSPHKPGYTSG